MKTWLTRLGAACLVVGATACGDIFGPGDEARLEEAEERWARHGPASYSYVLRHGCFCGGEITRGVRIVVENRIVVSRRYVDTGESVKPQFEDNFPAMEGVFQLIRDALGRDAAEVEAHYDAALGHPTRVSIDYVRNAIDDELELFVSDLQR